jgi:hypothetical protein
VWKLLVLRDNWQGEACIAIIGAIGWSLVAWSDPSDALMVRQYRLLASIMPERCWQVTLLLSGLVQLMGLLRDSHWLRAVGASGVAFCYICILLSFSASVPPLPGITSYMACGLIELFAVIYHTAAIVRYQEYPVWLWTGRV